MGEGDEGVWQITLVFPGTFYPPLTEALALGLVTFSAQPFSVSPLQLIRLVFLCQRDLNAGYSSVVPLFQNCSDVLRRFWVFLVISDG